MTAVWAEAGDGCLCWVNPNPYTYYGVVEPGDALQWNPECPMHAADAPADDDRPPAPTEDDWSLS